MGEQVLNVPEMVFFDWDGTLVDSYGFLNDAHGFVLDALGFPPFKEGEYKQYFGMPREILYPKIYKDKGEEAKALFESYVFDNAHKIQRMEGADVLLEALDAMDIPMGVISNKKADYIRKEAQHLGWGDYFSVVVGAGDAPEDKPSAAPMHHALSLMEARPRGEKIWLVGDTGNDLACARAFGCVPVFIEGHKDTPVLIETYKPAISAKNCAAVQKILVAL